MRATVAPRTIGALLSWPTKPIGKPRTNAPSPSATPRSLARSLVTTLRSLPGTPQTLMPWVLLTALTSTPAACIDAVELPLDSPLTWSEPPRFTGPRCFTVWVPEPGLLWIELATTVPSSAPGIFVLADVGQGAVPQTLHRIESVVLRVSEGEHLVCLTSQASLGSVELTASFLGREIATKERDEDEIELEPDL